MGRERVRWVGMGGVLGRLRWKARRLWGVGNSERELHREGETKAFYEAGGFMS
jgi:hypothetical protein